MPRGRPCAQQLRAPSGWKVTRGGALEGTAQATQVKAPQAPRFPLTPTLCAPMRLLSPDLSPGWGARAGAHTDRVSPWHRPNTARNPRRWTWNEAKGHGGGVWEMQGGEGVRPTGREESGRHAASLEVAEGFCTGSPAPGVRTS